MRRCESCGLYELPTGDCPRCGGDARPPHEHAWDGDGGTVADGTQPPGSVRDGPGGTDVHPAERTPPITETSFGDATQADPPVGIDHPTTRVREEAERLTERMRQNPEVSATATLTLEHLGETFEVAVEDWKVTMPVDGGDVEVEVEGRATGLVASEDDSAAESSGDASTTTSYGTNPLGMPLGGYPESGEIAASADEDEDEGPMSDPPDDGMCEACESAEWAIRMFDSKLDMHFYYCEQCANHKGAQFPSLSRDGAR